MEILFILYEHKFGRAASSKTRNAINFFSLSTHRIDKMDEPKWFILIQLGSGRFRIFKFDLVRKIKKLSRELKEKLKIFIGRIIVWNMAIFSIIKNNRSSVWLLSNIAFALVKILNNNKYMFKWYYFESLYM